MELSETIDDAGLREWVFLELGHAAENGYWLECGESAEVIALDLATYCPTFERTPWGRLVPAVREWLAQRQTEGGTP